MDLQKSGSALDMSSAIGHIMRIAIWEESVTG